MGFTPLGTAPVFCSVAEAVRNLRAITTVMLAKRSQDLWSLTPVLRHLQVIIGPRNSWVAGRWLSPVGNFFPMFPRVAYEHGFLECP